MIMPPSVRQCYPDETPGLIVDILLGKGNVTKTDTALFQHQSTLSSKI